LSLRARFAAALLVLTTLPSPARGLEASPVAAEIDRLAASVEGRMIDWRRHLHAHPELSNREFETAEFLVVRLREMGLEPRVGVAKTGVVAVIEGGRPGPVVALRADMDALPVREEVDLPFASTATGEYEGKPVPVMHACGHDTHMAMLLGTAEILTSLRERLPGKVVLLFQPAEEGVPPEEQPHGAELMVHEGVLRDPPVDAVFGFHVFAGFPAGAIGYRSGPVLAAADRFEIVVEGRQAHGSKPWAGVDPIVAGSEIVVALQTIVSRQIDITHEPAVVSIGQFEAGVRNNIIPDRARLVGTIRTFDEAMRDDIHARVTKMAESIAAAHGARATVDIERGYPVTVNDPELTARMLPTLERVAPGGVTEIAKITGAEDFSLYAREVPGLFLSLGVTPPEQMEGAASNHSPRFFVDESALVTGLRAFAHLAADYLFAGAR
jgi:amidohydrolase